MRRITWIALAVLAVLIRDGARRRDRQRLGSGAGQRDLQRRLHRRPETTRPALSRAKTPTASSRPTTPAGW
jgi:hypothetical protein